MLLWMTGFCSFYGWTVVYCYTYCIFKNSFISWWINTFDSMSRLAQRRLQVPLQNTDFISSRYKPSSEIVGSYGSSISNFGGISFMFSLMSVLIYILTNSSLFFTSSAIVAVLQFFLFGQFLLFWWVGVHCDIYKSSYNVSNVKTILTAVR
jgi:hypothetical protein